MTLPLEVRSIPLVHEGLSPLRWATVVAHTILTAGISSSLPKPPLFPSDRVSSQSGKGLVEETREIRQR